MDLLDGVVLLPVSNQARPQIAHGLDGRYGPMSPRALAALIAELAARMDTSDVDYVLGFPEGGTLPAYAFAQLIDRRLILSTRLVLPLEGAVSFEEPHSGLGTTHHLHGLRAGDRAVIVEDEVTTGTTVTNAVRALRQAGVRVDQVAALLVVDDPAVWRAMRASGITLQARFLLPREYATRLGAPPGPERRQDPGSAP